MTPDPLDGYRAGNPEDDFSPEERLLQQQMAANAKLIQLVERSEALREWLDSKAGEGFQDQVNIRLNEAMKTIMHASKLDSEEAKAAHFEMRVCMGILEVVDSVLNAGPEARRLVEISDRRANEEIGTNEHNG